MDFDRRRRLLHISYNEHITNMDVSNMIQQTTESYTDPMATIAEGKWAVMARGLLAWEYHIARHHKREATKSRLRLSTG